MQNAQAITTETASRDHASSSTTQPKVLTGMRRLLCVALDLMGVCGLAAAAVSIMAFYNLLGQNIDALLLSAFFLAFITALFCFAAARIVELTALAFESSHPAQPATTSAEPSAAAAAWAMRAAPE